VRSGIAVEGAPLDPRTPMDAGETQHVEALLRAFEEVLEYHERAGNADTEIVRELRAKQGELHERLNGGSGTSQRLGKGA
jgi:hypothetical protein